MTDRLRTVLVFGAGGQVGRQLIQRSAPQGFALLGLTHADADIADREAVEGAVRAHRPDIIVNCAAYTAVDKAETELDRAFAVNEAGPRNLALAAKDIGACSSTSRPITSLMGARPMPMSKTIPWHQRAPMAAARRRGSVAFGRRCRAT